MIMSEDLKVSVNDAISVKENAKAHPGFWKKTEVSYGYGGIVKPKTPFGKSSVKEEIGCDANTVPIGGVQYLMEDLFAVKGTQITVPTLYERNGIGLPDSTPPTETIQTPTGEKTVVRRSGNRVMIFGVGVTGSAENDITVYPVDYRENDLNMSRVSSDNLTINGTMIPFRYTAETLSETDRKKYFGKKKDETGKTGYYYKTFESEASIKHVTKTGNIVDDEEEELEVSDADVWDTSSGTNTIESFTEMILKVSKNDVREWFSALSQEDRTRINTIALLTGEFVKDSSVPGDDGDFRDVRLFSKAIINIEYLSVTKDLYIVYRVYGN